MQIKRLLRLIILFIYVSFNNCFALTKPFNEAWLSQNDSISIALFPYYPPYQFVNEHGEIDGVFIDYLELVEKKTGKYFKRIRYDDWSSLMADVKRGELDMILEIQATPDRLEYLEFYAFLFESKNVIVTRNDADYGSKIAHFNNKEVTLPAEYGIYELLESDYPKLKIIPLNSDLECLEQLNAGNYEAYIGPNAVVNYLIRTHKLDNLEIINGTSYSYKPGIAVVKQNTDLNKLIAKTTNNISNAEKQVILDRWLYTEVKPFYQKNIFWKIFLLVSGIGLLVLIAFNRYLKYKIGVRTKAYLKAKNEAEASNMLKTNFIHNISHEIRTPMNGIIGFSQLLKDRNLSQEDKEKYINTIVSSGQQLVSVVDDIMEISKLQTNQVRVHLEKTNLNTLMRTLVSIFEIKAEKKKLSIQLISELKPNRFTVLTDKSKLNKILSNLIDNAVKFTTSGQITITYGIKSSQIYFRIKDTGMGIKLSQQQSIFNSFQQLEKEISKKHKGLGLGLTLAKENVSLLGGEINFESKEHEGSEFEVKLPYYPALADAQIESTKASEATNLKATYNILVAEDVEVNFLLVKTILSKIESNIYNIHRAKNGQEAVDICSENKSIDLVIMDIRMPIMDGYEATRLIRSMRPNLPIIAHTAYSAEEDVHKAIEAGCYDFLSKPVDPKILKFIIQKYVSVLKQRALEK